MVTLRIQSSAGELSFEPGRTVVIGRDSDADVHLSNTNVSRRHAEITHSPDGWVLQDLGSGQGTWRDGRRVERVELRGIVTVTLGREGLGEILTLEATAGPATGGVAATQVTGLGIGGAGGYDPTVLPGQRPGGALREGAVLGATVVTGNALNVECGGKSYALQPGEPAVIGRDPAAQIVTSNPTVSRQHARLDHDGQGWVLRDLGSSGGTFVDGQKITEHRLSGSTAAWLGDETTGERLVMVTSGASTSTARRRAGSDSRVAAIAAAVALAVLVIAGATWWLWPDGDDEVADGEGLSYTDVQPAVVQILATGTFRDLEGVVGGTGSGSGFLISPDGYVVTNNHVVTGAATLEVYIGGALDRSYNAQVVGASECNDLALIKIAGASDLPYLEWYEGDSEVGMSVYAAGYPLGDPEYTLTSGILSKAQADGDITATASIDRTIEHTAKIQHGNSGGPLVAEDGSVVGVNYAGANLDVETTFYAIAADLARPIVERLYDGDFESIGINGFAVSDDADQTGIWVAAVKPGSPASKVGLRPGDVISAVNGLPMAMDGTFADYCDVIRTAGDGNPMAIEVQRIDTGEFLQGEINGASLKSP
jgi:S1-C subfamily serine protease/pSer/pThr/pTyr-binding forkhead associated (FHA) protein